MVPLRYASASLCNSSRAYPVLLSPWLFLDGNVGLVVAIASPRVLSREVQLLQKGNFDANLQCEVPCYWSDKPEVSRQFIMTRKTSDSFGSSCLSFTRGMLSKSSITK